MKKVSKKRKKKNILKKFFKGFTLVELLAVIVILAIIMLIAIPAVLETMETVRRKSFIEYVDKVSTLSQKQMAEDQMMGNVSASECLVYNIKTQLGLNNTGDYEGWVLIKPSNNDIYVTLFDDNYVIIGYHYSDSSLKMDDYIQKKTNENASKLTVEELCKSSLCSTCSVDGTEIDVSESEVGSYSVTKLRLYINSRIYSSVMVRSTPAEAMADWQDIIGTPGETRPFYLKHTLENNIIKENYIGFVITREMAAANSGMKAGTYSIRGGVVEMNLAEKPIYEVNKTVLLKAFGSSNCTESDLSLSCSVSGLGGSVSPTGFIVVGEPGSHGCAINSDASTNCN